MGSKVKFKIDRSSGAELLQSDNDVKSLAIDIANQRISEIETAFFQQFGVDGKFEVEAVSTDRMGFAIVPATAQTRAILQKNPDWIKEFV